MLIDRIDFVIQKPPIFEYNATSNNVADRYRFQFDLPSWYRPR